MRINRFWPASVLVGVLGISLLVSASSCKRDEAESGPAPSISAATDQPKLEIENAAHDFGTLAEGDKVSHTFKLTNRGGTPLVIQKTRTTCGCTVAKLATKQLESGASTDLEVKFDTRGRRNRQKKTITILSNDPDSPHTLTVSANVEALLTFEPRHVQLAAQHGKEVTREVWLGGKLADQAKLGIQSVEGDKLDDKQVVNVELADKEEDGKTKRGLRFKMKATKVGYGCGNVTVATGVEKTPTMKLFFRADPR